ncbi:Glutathione S-transferase T3 [Bienertia sinuspersici]
MIQLEALIKVKLIIGKKLLIITTNGRGKALLSPWNKLLIIVKNTHPSGHDEEQIISKAQQLYASQSQNKKRKFSYLHSWKILRKASKWKNYVSSQSGPYSTSTLNVVTNETNNVEVLDERPVGQKVAKADVKNKGKKKNNTHIDEKWSDYQDT